MRYPSLFVNHGGGPLPLLGRQPDIVHHMKEAVTKWLPSLLSTTEPPKAIVVISAHWESDPIQITSSPNPSMLYDYHGFPPESYQLKYPVPGSLTLAQHIQDLLLEQHVPAQLNHKRGLDHGVFVPLMIMYPKADIPVVCVSLHSSLQPEIHWKLGRALSPLRDEGILILGSGYAFHNMNSFFHPSQESLEGSIAFNNWLKETFLVAPSNQQQQEPNPSGCSTVKELRNKVLHWETAPGARLAHPREEHLLPLFVVAAASCSNNPKSGTPNGESLNGPINNDHNDDSLVPPKATLIYDSTGESKVGNHAISGYMFA
ncbi:hypothetical protein ACA910_016462 [Epithemia clementina (nom. ined.)]